jgi:hypothetical protein
VTTPRQIVYRARWPLGVLAGTLVLIRVLTAPGVQPADSGEFQLVARELGIAHPPGYALYTMAAHAWGAVATWAPVGTALGGARVMKYDPDQPGDADPWTWAVNAFSAFLATLVLAIVYRTGFVLTRARVGGLAAAVVLLATPAFLAQSAVANIRMPTALFTALLLFLTIKWLAVERRRSADSAPPSPDWRLAALALVAGLAAGHHGSLAFLAAASAILVVWSRPSVLRDLLTMAAVAGALVLAFVPLLYLPIRDFQGALFDENRLTTLGGFLNHISAADFRGDALYFRDLTMALDRAQVVAGIFVIQFGYLALLLAACGLFILLLGKDRLAGVLLAAVVGLTAVLTMTYRAPQTMEYLLPAYVAVALAAGTAIAAVARWRPGAIPLGRIAVALWFVVAGVSTAQTADAVRAATPALNWLPETFGAFARRDSNTMLANWHFYTPLLYLYRHSYGTMPSHWDIEYVYPEGSETPGETWLKRIRSTPGNVVITNRPREVAQAGVPLWPVPLTPFYDTGQQGSAWGMANLSPAPVFGAHVAMDRAWSDMLDDGRVHAVVELQAQRPITETLTITAQIVDPTTGALWGQVDHAFPPSRWNDPRGLVDESTIVPFRGSMPAQLQTIVGIYRNTKHGLERLPVNGTDSVRIGEYRTASTNAQKTAPASPSGVPYGDAMTLVHSAVRRNGDQLVVDLTWRADATAAASDYTISVQAHGDGWSAQDDGTPAMGAIPTLKWLPGMVIHDRHRLQLPAGLPLDAPFHVTVGAYDAFSLEPLPVTDAERVRQGQGQAAEVWRQGR